MATKQFVTRVQHKHDTEANWLKAVNFKPLSGEVVIYAADSTHPFPRVKIGDGSTNVNELPFATGEEAGITFTPSVSDDGIISWTNNGGLDNPEPVNIKGESGVYVGSGDMPDGYNVQIDPDGEVLDVSFDIKSRLSLGIASDGLIYIFVDGAPIGTGIPQGQSGDVFGYVDENNTVVLTGNLADGTYSIKYEMDNGKTVNIGNMVLDSNVYYAVTSNLTNCTNNNSTKSVVAGSSYSATITANNGYTLKAVTVTMGGQSVAVSGGTINIANVTGNIVITAVAEEVKTEPTNQIPISINSDKTLFVGQNGEKGYKLNTRLSSSSGSESTSNASGIEVTGFIPVKYGDTVYLKDITVTEATTEVIGFYNSSFTKIVCAFAYRFGTTTGGVVSLTLTSDNIEDQNLTSALAYIRLSAKEINANSIITVNEPIV